MITPGKHHTSPLMAVGGCVTGDGDQLVEIKNNFSQSPMEDAEVFKQAII